jgi:hypothetical protein
MVLGLALTLGACGGGGGNETAAAARAGAAENQAVGTSSGDAIRCRRQLQPLLGAMASLRSRLAVGLSYHEYLAEVRAVRAAHARIAARRLPLGCLSLAGAPAERALNDYIRAVNAWGDCLAVASCESETVEPELQRIWQRASGRLAEAEAGMRRISPG